MALQTTPDAAGAPASFELPPRLRCQGGQLVKPNGNPITLKGPSLGMWGSDEVSDIQDIKATGANSPRIVLRWHGKWGKPEVDSRDNQAVAFLKRENVDHWIDLIQAASDEGMWPVATVDTNCGQSGTQSPEMIAYCDPYGQFGALGRNLYTDASLRRLFTTIVLPALAARLRPIERVAMLEIHAEPAVDRGPEYADAVARVQLEAMNAIREVDRDTPFLLGPRDAYNIALVDECYFEGRDDCVATGNLLNQYVADPAKFDEGFDTLLRFRDRRGWPIYINQLARKTGADRRRLLMRRALRRCREAQVGYAWWQWNQNTTDGDDYGCRYKAPDWTTWIEKTEEIELLSEDFRGEL